ncbi:MAG TPA: hypothetical protein IAC99_08120 [Candidatus Choladocola avistercoris]|nr:hypothetical protein [Candidatus Choladocola avistercoris]
MTQKKKGYLRILTPPDDLTALLKTIRRLRLDRIRRILSIVILIWLGLCGTLLLMQNQTYGRARTSDQYPSGTTDSSRYKRFADGIVRYNRDGVSFLNKKNEELWMQPTQLQNPVIVVKDKAFAVADNGGNSILVFSEDGLTGEIETTLPVERISISDQGIVSVILRNENTPEIITYDAAGNILAEMQISPGNSGYPTALEMSDDGNTLAVSYLSVSGTGMKSRLVYYNFGEAGQDRSDNIVFSEDYNDTVFGEIFFMGGGRSVAVADRGFQIIRGTDKPELDRRIPLEQEIQSVFHSDEYIGFILLNEQKSGYELRLYNRIGEQMISRELPGKYSHAKIDGDEIFLYDGDQCCIVTATGIIKYQGDLAVEALEIFPAFGINRYYVMSVDELRVVYLTK